MKLEKLNLNGWSMRMLNKVVNLLGISTCRIAGILSNATTKEIQKEKIKAFAKVGKEITVLHFPKPNGLLLQMVLELFPKLV